MDKTFVTKPEHITREWYVVDAADQNLGRLASRVAAILRGKHKPIFTPAMDVGDYVVVVNAEKLDLAAKKLDQKLYRHHTLYPGGLKTITLRDQLKKHPERVIRSAVWGMLPHNRLGKAMLKKLKVYAGPAHPHSAQNPRPLE